MEVFHVISWGAARVALEMLPPRSINVLVSAWYWVIAPGTMRKAEPLLRDRANLLLVDSGALSALKAGRRDYLGQQDHVFEIAGRGGADRVAMLDVPMEPRVLGAGGLSAGEALDITLRNAEEAVRRRPRGLGLVNQGYSLEQRAACHAGMQHLYPHAAWFGIGSVCMRRPPELYEHAHWCRKNLPGHLHCFGIGSPVWIRELQTLGIDSVDSGSAMGYTRQNRVRTGNTITALPRSPRDNVVNASLFILNMRHLELAVQRGTPGEPT